MTDLDQVGMHDRLDGLRLEQQVLAGLRPAVATQDEIGDFHRVCQCVFPAGQAGAAESRHPLRVQAEFLLAGEQHIAVEVDAIIVRVDDPVGNAALLQKVRFVGGVGVIGIGLAVDQILDAETARADIQTIDPYSFAGKGHQEFRVLHAKGHHQTLAQKVLGRMEVATCQGQPDVGRALEQGRQRHHRLALFVGHHQTGIADAILGMALQHLIERGGPTRAGLTQFDVQTLACEITAFLRRVIAGKLKLVQPAQL